MSRPAVVRRVVAAAVLPLALTSLSACGSDEGAEAEDSSSSSTGGSAAADTPEAGSTVAPADFADLYRESFDNTTTAHMNMKLAMMGQQITGAGDVDYSQDSPAVAMTMDGAAFGGQSLEVRMLDNVMYLDMGSMTQGKFVKMDLDSPDSPLGSLADSMDPSRSMDALESALEKVTYVGADGDGDHYEATVDTAAMMKGMGQDVPASAQLPKTLSYDAWFDSEGRFSRMVMDMGSAGTTEMKLSDFGADVSIEAPPADQITDQGLSMAG
ncbi:hypothetical protein GCM10009844_17180 [Nocardioides koreensis]|uniref:LppX_LprAFG lipoprotein n=1 Tax=Nocardioides koreensis TaxID=433651 RepID=A0ABP5LCU0_9ACTN